MRRLLFALIIFCATLTVVAQDFPLELMSAESSEPAVAATHEVRVGVLDMKAVFHSLPETTELQQRINRLQATYQAELQKLEDEYQNKVSTYLTDRDRLPKNIQDARIQEIDQMQLRIQAMRKEAAEDLDRRQAEETEPLRLRVNAAIRQVCEELGLAYVLDSNSDAVLYVSPSHTINIYANVMSVLNDN